MNINTNLDLLKTLVGGLALAKKGLSSKMKTAVMSPEEKAVSMELLLEQEKKEKAEEQKEKEEPDQYQDQYKEFKKIEEKNNPISKKDEAAKKVIERDPLKLLKLL